MSTDSTGFKPSQMTKNAKLSVDQTRPIIPQLETPETSNLQFDRLQPSLEDLHRSRSVEFGNFVAREAVIDEELWAAAWLRAESNWEDQPNDKLADSNKRKFTEQEFNALKRRCNAKDWQDFSCIVAVKKEDKNIKCTVLKSVVGTLDLSIRHLLQGETFPGERVKAPLFCSTNRTEPSRYGYVANVCVSRSARRQSIASNMLRFALKLAESAGLMKVYVHVHRKNIPAQELYAKLGFEMMEAATSQLSREKTYLLCHEIQDSPTYLS